MEKITEDIKINRLFLVGNGFDLAHGLPTSYNDFIKWYLVKVIRASYTGLLIEDNLLNFKKLPYTYLSAFERCGLKSVEEYVEYFYKNGFQKMLEEHLIVNDYIVQNPYKFIIKSKLFEKVLLTCSNLNWVNIEQLFYEELKETLKNGRNKIEKVKEINQTIEAIVMLLKEYLETVDCNVHVSEYSLITSDYITQNDFLGIDLKNLRSVKFNQNLILNFNYTSTINKYIPYKDETYKLNNIHGNIEDFNADLIFGFGDEYDDDYHKLENDSTKEFLKYIKSFWYFKTINYHDLIRFIDSDIFQVCILGHSCGLSDRTMLKMIFEHENCKSIKIYYHKQDPGNNYTELTQEMSRHFSNKQEMRRKIVPFVNCEPMPQIKLSKL